MYNKEYKLWCERATKDPDIVKELKEFENNDEAKKEAFYKNLEFGTGGLRGVIGAGTNRMNVYTVAKATQGLAAYVNSVSKNGKVAVAYDSRIKSDVFARTTAEVLAANGIKVYIYPELMPTPMLSFAVRHYSCDAGVVITASHNPAIYNGYKAYGPDGCQLTLEAAEYVLSIMDKVDIFDGVKSIDFETALSEGKIEYISQEAIECYLDEVQKCSVADKGLNLGDLKVIYTPIHGSGNKPVRAILKRIGIENVTVVKEQELPDGNFPTAPYPNPEIRQPFEIALKMAEEIGPDILLATDPDCDRVGIAVNHNGEFKLLTGNDVGILLLDYICKQRTKNGTMPKNPIAVKTIVTSEMCRGICKDFGVELIDVLTGFKFIGEQIGLLEEKGEEDRYIFGFEESYGYLAGSYVRDKDAVIGSMLICEMTAYYKNLGLTLVDALNALFEKYGYYICAQSSFAFEGISGMEKMKNIMNELRTNSPSELCGVKITEICDYELSVKKNLLSGEESVLTLPKSNVLAFTLENGCGFIVRPSGTEPKIKIYFSSVADTLDASNANIDEMKKGCAVWFK